MIHRSLPENRGSIEKEQKKKKRNRRVVPWSVPAYRNNLSIISAALAWYRKSHRPSLFFTHKKVFPIKLGQPFQPPSAASRPRTRVQAAKGAETDTPGWGGRAEEILVRANLCRRKSSVMLEHERFRARRHRLIPADPCQTLSAVSVGNDLRLS